MWMRSIKVEQISKIRVDISQEKSISQDPNTKIFNTPCINSEKIMNYFARETKE